MINRQIWARLMTVFVSTVLVACAADKDRKNAKDMEKEAAAKVAEINSINAQLMEDGVYAIPGVDATKLPPVKWSRYDAQKRKRIQTRLETIRDHVGRIFEIRAHKNMRPKGDGADLERVRKNAQFHLDSLYRDNKTQGLTDPDRTRRGQELIVQINARVENLRKKGIELAQSEEARARAEAQSMNWSELGNEKRLFIRSQLTQLIGEINQVLKAVVSAPEEELRIARTLKRNAQIFLDYLNRFDRGRAA